MKLFEMNSETGTAQLKIDSQMDLWHLEKVIQPGDLVTAKTMRSVFLQREERKEKIKKIYVTLTIKVEKIEFHDAKHKLRIIGKITDAPKDVKLGSYHSIELGVGKNFSIKKSKWVPEQLKTIERAQVKIGKADYKTMNEFFVHIAKDDKLVVYGLEHTKQAVDMSAVRILLVPESKLREEEIDRLVRSAERKAGEVRLVEETGEIGKRFCKQYGIGAILRFRIE